MLAACSAGTMSRTTARLMTKTGGDHRLHHAKEQEPPRRGRHQRARRRGQKDGQRPKHHGPAAETVADRPAKQLQHRADPRNAETAPLDQRVIDAEILGHARQGWQKDIHAERARRGNRDQRQQAGPAAPQACLGIFGTRPCFPRAAENGNRPDPQYCFALMRGSAEIVKIRKAPKEMKPKPSATFHVSRPARPMKQHENRRLMTSWMVFSWAALKWP